MNIIILSKSAIVNSKDYFIFFVYDCYFYIFLIMHYGAANIEELLMQPLPDLSKPSPKNYNTWNFSQPSQHS